MNCMHGYSWKVGMRWLASISKKYAMKKTQVKASDANLNFKYPASQGNERSGDIPKPIVPPPHVPLRYSDFEASISMNPPVWTPTIATGNTIAHAIHCGCVQPLTRWDAAVVKEGEHLESTPLPTRRAWPQHSARRSFDSMCRTLQCEVLITWYATHAASLSCRLHYRCSDLSASCHY
jgi:hypothetical protein